MGFKLYFIPVTLLLLWNSLPIASFGGINTVGYEYRGPILFPLEPNSTQPVSVWYNGEYHNLGSSAPCNDSNQWLVMEYVAVQEYKGFNETDEENRRTGDGVHDSQEDIFESNIICKIKPHRSLNAILSDYLPLLITSEKIVEDSCGDDAYAYLTPSGNILCHCHQNLLHVEGHKGCYKAYTRGPCRHGMIVNGHHSKGSCVYDKCATQNTYLQLENRGRVYPLNDNTRNYCYALGSTYPCSIGKNYGELVLSFDGAKYVPTCSNEHIPKFIFDESCYQFYSMKTKRSCYYLYERGPCPEGEVVTYRSVLKSVVCSKDICAKENRENPDNNNYSIPQQLHQYNNTYAPLNSTGPCYKIYSEEFTSSDESPKRFYVDFDTKSPIFLRNPFVPLATVVQPIYCTLSSQEDECRDALFFIGHEDAGKI